MLKIKRFKARHCEKLESVLKLESLGAVAVKPLDFDVPIETPYIDLAIPVNYKLNAYRPLFDSTYVPKYEQRLQKLRSGAEDELTHQTTTTTTTTAARSMSSHSKSTMSTKQQDNQSISVGQPKTVSETPSTELADRSAPRIVDLVPGKYLTEPVEYPPMHIFVSIADFFGFWLL